MDEASCQKAHNMLFQHKIEGLIIGLGLDNNKETLALALALYDQAGKQKGHNYYIRIYEIYKELDKNQDFEDIFLGNGNVVLSLTVEENLVVFFRMFDDVLFNTLMK